MRQWLWPAVLLAALGAFVFGVWGFDRSLGAPGEPASFGDELYRSLQLFVFEYNPPAAASPWQLDVARVLATFASVVVAFSAIAVIFREQRSRIFARHVARRHVIVCGLGPCGALMAKGFAADGHTVVAVETMVTTATEECRELGITVLIGDAAEPFLLSSLGVQRALLAVVSCGSDGVNARVTAGIAELVSTSKARKWRKRHRVAPLSCFVHVDDEGLCRLLKGSVAVAEARARDAGPALELEFFNPSQTAAPGMFTAKEVDPADEQPTTVSHRLVVGLGEMGQELVVHMARCWWVEHGARLGKLRLTLVDRAIEERTRELWSEPGLQDHCELVEALPLDVSAPEFTSGDFLFDPNGRARFSAVFICLDDDARGLSAALALRTRLRTAGAAASAVPVVVRLSTSTGVGSLLDRRVSGSDPYLVPFGLADWACTPNALLDRTNELLARLSHAQYVRERMREGADVSSAPAMRPWDELSSEDRASNRAMAADVDRKLEAIGCVRREVSGWDGELVQLSEDEVELLAEMEHDRWWAFKRQWGYRFGPVSDRAKKLNALMVPWDQLSEADKDYDRRPVADLPRFLLYAGYLVHRTDASAR